METLDKELPLPPHFRPETVGSVWRVPYQLRAREAESWRPRYSIHPACTDEFRIGLLIIDVQNTFCHPDFELFVAGRTGLAAVEDSRRLCGFIYRNLNRLTRVCPTMDTHHPIQIFHSMFLVNQNGEHPNPFTPIAEADIRDGTWSLDPAISDPIGLAADHGGDYLRHYARKLKEKGKYEWTIWPYHALLGGIGHALVAAVEEAIFFHSVTRRSQPLFQLKGGHPLTEHYSALGPEVEIDHQDDPLARKDESFLGHLHSFDRLIIAGQAKSHCVAWTVEDLLQEDRSREQGLAERIYLLEDCMSPVVVPGVVDYTEATETIFQKFSDAGVHRVPSTQPLSNWPGFNP